MENQSEKIYPHFVFLVASCASFFKEKKRVDAQEVCVNRQLVGGHT